LKPHLLLESRFTRQPDTAAGADNTMPGDIRTRVPKRPHYLPGGAGKTRRFRDFTVRRYPPPRNPPHHGSQLVEHYLAPVISFNFSKNAFFRGVSSPQFTGGD
jgi:hypothetical protein